MNMFANNSRTSARRRDRIECYITTTLLLCLLFLPVAAMASGSTTTSSISTTMFDDVYNWLKAIVLGTGGKVVALAIFFIGMVASLVRQTAMPAVLGIGVALLLAFIPGMIESILGAAL